MFSYSLLCVHHKEGRMSTESRQITEWVHGPGEVWGKWEPAGHFWKWHGLSVWDSDMKGQEWFLIWLLGLWWGSPLSVPQATRHRATSVLHLLTATFPLCSPPSSFCDKGYHSPTRLIWPTLLSNLLNHVGRGKPLWKRFPDSFVLTQLLLKSEVSKESEVKMHIYPRRCNKMVHLGYVILSIKPPSNWVEHFYYMAFLYFCCTFWYVLQS